MNGCYLLISVVLPGTQEISDKDIIGKLLKIGITGNNIFDIYEGDII